MKISMKNKLFLEKKNYLRLLCLAALIVCAGVSAFSQVTLNVKDKPIRQVLKTIEKTTDYKFFYNDDFAALNKLVTINVTNVSLDNALKAIFQGSGISWKKQSDKLIVLIPAKSEGQEGATSGSEQHKIFGIVVDANTGETLPGVNIFVAGKKIGVVSNLDGKFSIDLPSAYTLLEISYLGYVEQTITPGKQTNLKIALEPDVKRA
jgi:TonB-dependent starch-binding outer membrane protein SusC